MSTALYAGFARRLINSVPRNAFTNAPPVSARSPCLLATLFGVRVSEGFAFIPIPPSSAPHRVQLTPTAASPNTRCACLVLSTMGRPGCPP